MKIQPAVKKETGHIACWSGAGTILMIVAFAVCHKLFPDAVPFDYKVVLGGVIGAFITYTVIVAIIGAAVSVGNFFIMGLTVQKIASGEQSDEQAYKSMKISYRYRSMAQLLWIVLAMVLPFVNAAAGIIPLFFPSLSIKLINILGIIKAKPNL